MYGGGSNYGMMGGGMGMGGMGMGGMGMGGGMMMMGYPQKQKSLFSLSNVLTGVALYGMYRSLTGGFGGGGGGMYGGGYNGPREVHIYDHREHKPADPNDLKPILGTVGLPQSVTGESIQMPGKTMEEITAVAPPAQNITQVVNGTEVVVEDPLPPLPFDTQPKIYYGYGFAYGYQNATVDLLSAKDGRKVGELRSSPQQEEAISTTDDDDEADSRASSSSTPTESSTVVIGTSSTMGSQAE